MDQIQDADPSIQPPYASSVEQIPSTPLTQPLSEELVGLIRQYEGGNLMDFPEEGAHGVAPAIMLIGIAFLAACILQCFLSWWYAPALYLCASLVGGAAWIGRVYWGDRLQRKVSHHCRRSSAV